MKKVYHKLTEEQKTRGVIFSSTLSTNKVELMGDTVHEVLKDDEEPGHHIELLKNDKFFNNSPYKYNIIRS